MIFTKLFQKLKYFTSQGNPRSIRAARNIGVSFVSKGVSIIISFLIVPLTLEYVGEVEYGLWMTISSIILWFSFFDIGLGNGLRNKLAESIAQNNLKEARIYVSSSFALIFIISSIMLLGFFLGAHKMPWNKIFNVDIFSNEELTKIVSIVFLFFSIGFVLNIISSILQALQKYWIKDILGVLAQFLGLVGIFFLVNTTEGSLLRLCIVYAGKTPIIMLIAGVILFSGSLRYLVPRFKYINLKKAFPLVNLGVRFFLNQILYIIVTQSSVILVAQFFGPAEVTVYNLAVRYMTIASMIYMMVLTPFLSAFTEAYTKNEIAWIKLTISRINKVWIISSIFTIIMVFTYKLFFHIWVGDSIKIPLPLIVSLAISSIVHTYYNKYSLFLNGIGKIHLQSYLLGFQALIFIPLSLLFYKLSFGLSSLVLSQIIIYSITAIFISIQYNKIINRKAIGIWNK